MAAPPGWYPDPQNPHRTRYWDGVRWTVHVQNPPTLQAASPPTPPEPRSGYPDPQAQSEQSGYPQVQSQSASAASPSRTSRPVVLWMAAGMVIALFIVGGLLLFLNSQQQAANQAGATTSQGAPSAGSPAVTASGSSGTAIRVGHMVSGESNCPTTAGDAQGTLTDGRIVSPGGLSYPAIQDFSPSPVNYGFIHQSNSMTKNYPNNEGRAAVTVGTLRTEDGFESSLSSAVRVVQCVIGNSAFYSDNPTAEVTRVTENQGDGTAVLQVHVPVSGRADNTGDDLAVAVYPDRSRKQVVLSLVPRDDSAARQAVNTALAGLSLNS